MTWKQPTFTLFGVNDFSIFNFTFEISLLRFSKINKKLTIGRGRLFGTLEYFRSKCLERRRQARLYFCNIKKIKLLWVPNCTKSADNSKLGSQIKLLKSP